MNCARTETLIDRYPELEPLSPVYLNSGLFNDCYLFSDSVGGKVLRWRREGVAGRALEKVVSFEKEIHRFLLGQNIAVGCHEQSWVPADCLLLDYFRAEPLNYDCPRHMYLVGQLYGRLHALRVEDLGKHVESRDLSSYREEIESYLSVVPVGALGSFLHDCLAESPKNLTFSSSRALVHGDGGFTNIFVAAEEARLLDWEWAELSYPQFDLAHFLSPLVVARRPASSLSSDKLSQFWLGYHGRAEEPAWTPSVEEIKPFVELRALAWLAHRYHSTGRLSQVSRSRLCEDYWNELRSESLVVTR